MARRTKLTPERTDEIAKNIRAGLPFETAAIRAGITEKTFYNWRNRGEEKEAEIIILEKAGKGSRSKEKNIYFQFLQVIKKAEADSEAVLLLKIQNDTSWQSSAWILERRFRDRYSVRQEITGKDGKDLYEGMSEEDKADIVNRIKNADK